MIYLGKVTRVDGTKLYVSIPALGSSTDEFGPLNAIADRTNFAARTTTSGGDPSHTHSVAQHLLYGNEYLKGDRVVVAQVGNVLEDMVVLGRIDS